MPTKTKPRQGYRFYFDRVALSGEDRKSLREMFGCGDADDATEILEALQEHLNRYDIWMREAEQAPLSAHVRAEIEVIEQAAGAFCKSARELMDCLAPARLTSLAREKLEPALPQVEREPVVPESQDDAIPNYEQRRTALWSKSLPALQGEAMFLAMYARKVLEQWPQGLRSDNSARRRCLKKRREELNEILSRFFLENTKDVDCQPEFLKFCQKKIKQLSRKPPK